MISRKFKEIQKSLRYLRGLKFSRFELIKNSKTLKARNPMASEDYFHYPPRSPALRISGKSTIAFCLLTPENDFPQESQLKGKLFKRAINEVNMISPLPSINPLGERLEHSSRFKDPTACLQLKKSFRMQLFE